MAHLYRKKTEECESTIFFAQEESYAVSSGTRTRVAWGGVSFSILSIYLCPPTYLYELFIEWKKRYKELFNGLSFEFEVI